MLPLFENVEEKKGKLYIKGLSLCIKLLINLIESAYILWLSNHILQMNESLKHDNYVRPELELPVKDSKLLLHSCCAPCAGEIMEAVAASTETTAAIAAATADALFMVNHARQPHVQHSADRP